MFEIENLTIKSSFLLFKNICVLRQYETEGSVELREKSLMERIEAINILDNNGNVDIILDNGKCLKKSYGKVENIRIK